jgi:hypothetical protein
VTQSGQSEESSARPAREGIVLPSDGGEPLLPGMTGGQGGGRPPVRPAGRAPAAAPADGRAWGRPWGPEQQTPPPPPGQGVQEPPAQSWGSPESYQPAQQAQWDAQGPAAAQPGTGAHPGAGPLPPEGAPAPAPTHDARSAGPQPPYQQDHQAQSGHHAQQDFHAQPGHPSAPPSAPLPPAGPVPYGTPPEQAGPYGQAGYNQAGPYAAGRQVPGAPAGQAAGEAATQYLPPVPGAPVPGAPADEGATQYLPPVAAAPAGEGATQYLPPVTPGAMPPEASGDQATRFLGRVPQGGAGPLPHGGNPDAEATQYIPPVDTRADGRQTPAEFDNLFRSDSGGAAPVTQQLPRFQPPPAQGHAQPAYAQPGYVPPAGGGHEGDGGDGGGRRRSRVPLIAAVGVGIVVIGVGAGALLSGGGGGGKSGEKNTTVSATSPATGGSSQASGADPARQQAVALDKLLADSGSSRASVIKAVAEVKACDNLDQAGSDLRSAAQQRNDLVTRLKQLPVDKLPRHGELTASLTRAWQASASADQHYAAWAGQAGGKKGCKKGHARTTGETQAGNQQSGVASAEKVKAAQLWNAIASQYGLTQRQPTQL